MRSTTTPMPRDCQPSGAPGRARRPAGRCVLIAGLGALLALTGATGCSSRPEAGGATTTKAKNARKDAEAYAVQAVQGAVAAEVEARPEFAKPKSVWGRAVDAVARLKAPAPTVPVSAQSPAAPPAPPAPPLPPPGASRPPPPPVIVSRGPPPRPVARPGGRVVIHEQVTSEVPYPTEAEAEAATLEQATEVVARKLSELSPPVEFRPSAAVVKNDYVRADSRVVRSPTAEEKELIKRSGYHTDRVYVEYTVELTTDQVRELRASDRLGTAFRVFGVIGAAALVGFGFLRLDEWSKGYLTSWLAFIALGLVGGAGIALLLV